MSVSAFRMVDTVNNDYFPEQYYSVDLCNVIFFM
jgi:hypothetical protein